LDPIPFNVATPTFSPEPGTFTTLQHVDVTCSTEDAEIHYTTDGTDPTDESPVCEPPVAVSDTMTIKAKAYKDGWAPSEIATGVFTLDLKRGDINGDGIVDLADVILVFQVMTGMVSDSAVCMAADVNDDGKIDLADAGYILQAMWGKENRGSAHSS
jgi:hypothetical protein